MSRRSNAFGVGISSLPSWADYTALPNGQFIEFTTNTPQDVNMVGQTIANWDGGAFVPDYGTRGGLAIVGGGEHFSWVDSQASGASGQQGAYVLDCDGRVFARKCYPVTSHTGGQVDGTGYTGSPTDDWGAYTDDGSPQSKHTYNCISYMPASWGGGSSGSLMRVSHLGGVSQTRFLADGAANSAGYAATWRYDLSKAAHSSGVPSIFKLTGSSTYNYGSGVIARTNDSTTACIDLVREGWWSTHSTKNVTYGERMVFTSKTGVISAPQGGSGHGLGYAAMHHFADDDTIVLLSDVQLPDAPANQSPYEITWVVKVWQAGTSNAWQSATISRQDISDTFSPSGFKAFPWMGYMQPRWSSILGCFVGYDFFYNYTASSTTTIRVWKITPPPAGQRFSGTWTATWELVTAKPGTESTNFMDHRFGGLGDSGTSNGVFGRLVECPSLRAFVWVRDIDKKGQLIRLQGM